MRQSLPIVSRTGARALAFVSLIPLGACGLLNALEDDGSLVDVFVSHHATPRDGEFPDYGMEEYPRVFVTDQGWEVTLAEAYVTVVGVQIATCSGNASTVDLYWGPCAEDFIGTKDASVVGIGAAGVHAGTYCSAAVFYGPFQFAVAEAGEPAHELPDNELVDGKTVYVRGKASKDGVDVQFEWSTAEELVVIVDLSTLDGGNPIEIQHDEAFPTQLTIGKSYDHYFEGLDFADYSDAELKAAIMSSLELDTRAHLGAGVQVQYAAP